MGLFRSTPTLKPPLEFVALRVQISIGKEAVAAQDPVTTRRLWRLQHEVGLADAFKVMRRPLVGYLLKRVGPRFLNYTVEVSKRGFARPWRDRECVACY